MKFNSQICTTKIQSERLLALGLKKETADMCINLSHELVYSFSYSEALTLYYNYGLGKIMEADLLLPAWSLNRLIEMMPSFVDIGEHNYMFSIIQGKLFSYGSDIVGNAFLYGKGSVYDSAIYTIEWLIGEGCFNKEYLEHI